MMGNVADKGEQQLHGIIPRSIAHIFHTLANQQQYSDTSTAPVSYAVGMSYFEIYNEKVYDLLATTPDATRTPLDVRETPDHQTYVEELTTRLIGSTDEALRWIERGNENRRVAATAHNVVSSRSHGVIQVTVERKTGGGVTVSRLSLVDLAGSEKYDSATHGSSSRDGRSKREEMSAINQSLSTLALVVNALTQQQQRSSTNTTQRPQATHIPYRNSTLTHLLKDSLGGHSKAAIIACINPTVEAAYESTNTLKWASNAKHIRNTVKREEERGSHNDNTAFIASLHAEIERLKRSERVEKCKRYRVYDLLPDFAMKVLEDAPEDDGLAKQVATDMEECKELPQQAMLHLGEEKIIAVASDSDDSILSVSRRSSADLSVRLHDTLLESTVSLDSTLDEPSGCATSSRGSPRRAQVAGVFASPSRMRWKVVRETFSSEIARKPLDESAGTESTSAALFSPASQRRLEKADEEFGQRRASWWQEKEKVRKTRYEMRRVSVRESEKSIREVQQRYDTKCAELEDIKAAYDEERCATEEERKRLLHQLDTVEEQNADKEEEVGRLLNELAACEARIAASQEQYAVDGHNQSELLAGRSAEIEALQVQLQEAETQRIVVEQRIAQLQSELRAVDGVTERLTTHIAKLTLDIAARDEQHRLNETQHQQQVQQLASEVQAQQAQLNKLMSELATEQATHAADKALLEQTAERLQCQLDEVQHRQAAIQAEATASHAQYEASLQTAQLRLTDQLAASEKVEQASIERQREAATQQKERVASLQAQQQALQAQLAASNASLSSAESEHRADRIRLMQQFDAQLHSEQQTQRSEQHKYNTALQKRRQVETAVIEQINTRHQQQIIAVEQQLAALKAETAQQQLQQQVLTQAESEARIHAFERQLATLQQQHAAELVTLSESKEGDVAAVRAALQVQVETLEAQLAAVTAETAQQRACHEAEVDNLKQCNIAATSTLRTEYDEAVAALKSSQAITELNFERQLSEQAALGERLQSHIQLVETTLAELKAEVETARQLLEESQQHVVQLQSELDATNVRHQQQIEQKNVQLLTTTYIACAAQTALKRRTAAHDAASVLITRLTDEKQQLGDEINALQVDMAAMQATHELQLDAKDEQLASRTNTIARLQGSGDESEADRVALHQRIDQLQDAMIDSEAHRQHLASRIEALQAASRQKDDLLAIVQADAASQRVSAEASRERQVAELTGQIKTLYQQQSSTQAEHAQQTNELNEQLSVVQRGVKAKEESLATVTATLSSARAARRDEAFAHHVRVSSLEQQLDITESARSDAADNVRQLAADKQQLQHQLTDNQKQVMRLEAQLADAIARRDAAEASQKEVRAQCTARVRAIELKSQAAMAEEKSERYTELAATMAGYDAQVSKLKVQLANNHAQLDAANSHNTQLHDHIAALTEQQQYCSCSQTTQPDATTTTNTSTTTLRDNKAAQSTAPAQGQSVAAHGGVATRVIGVLRFVTFGFVTDSLGFCTR